MNIFLVVVDEFQQTEADLTWTPIYRNDSKPFQSNRFQLAQDLCSRVNRNDRIVRKLSFSSSQSGNLNMPLLHTGYFDIVLVNFLPDKWYSGIETSPLKLVGWN